jgi:branched-chain amino acid transport system permease protein
VPGRKGAYLPFVVGATLVVVMAVLPPLNIFDPRHPAGSDLHAGLARPPLAVHGVRGSRPLLQPASGDVRMLSFGHALYFGVGRTVSDSR